MILRNRFPSVRTVLWLIAVVALAGITYLFGLCTRAEFEGGSGTPSYVMILNVDAFQNVIYYVAGAIVFVLFAVLVTLAALSTFLSNETNKALLRRQRSQATAFALSIIILVALTLLGIFETHLDSHNPDWHVVLRWGLAGVVGAISFFIGNQVLFLNLQLSGIVEQIETGTTQFQNVVGAQLTVATHRMLYAALNIPRALARNRVETEELNVLGLAVDGWNRRIGPQQPGQPGRDPELEALWTNYLVSYFREEAFDISRQTPEVVTNGRNVCTFFLESIQAILKSVGDRNKTAGGGQSKARVCFITPLHPKDWYNWPHQSPKTGRRAYIENWFYGFYCRMMAQQLRANKEALQIERIVLGMHANGEESQQHDLAKEKSRLLGGWPLEAAADFADLGKAMILNVPVPHTVDLSGLQCSFAKKLAKYYQEFNSELGGEVRDNETRNGGGACWVPLWSPLWAVYGAGSDKQRSAGHGELNALFRSHLINGKCPDDCETQIHQRAKNAIAAIMLAARTAVDAYLKQFKASFDEPPLDPGASLPIRRVKELWWEIHPMMTTNSPVDDPVSLMRKIHEFDMMLQYAEAPLGVSSDPGSKDRVHEHVTTLLVNKMRLTSCEQIGEPRWERLDQAFANDFQSDQHLARYSLLEDPFKPTRKINLASGEVTWTEYLRSNQIPLEMSLFGVDQGDGNTQWKMVLLTDFRFPFTIARIQLHEVTQNDDDPYVRWYNFLKNGSRPIVS